MLEILRGIEWRWVGVSLLPGLVLMALAVTPRGGAEPEPELPIVLTFSPTATPSVIPRAAYNFIGGSLDAHFQSTPEPTIPTLPDLQDVSEAAAPAQYDPPSTVAYQFLEGWRAGGGPKDDASAWRLVICESQGRIVSGGGFWGLLQFLPSTWNTAAAATGLYDAYDAYSQGYNGAWHAQYGTINPGGTGGWPVCWWA